MNHSNNSFHLSALKAMSHDFCEEDEVSTLPTLPNTANSMFNSSLSLSASQALSRGYWEENGASNPVTIPRTLPDTEISMFNNSFPFSAPQVFSHSYSEENRVSGQVTIWPTLPNIENSVFNESFPFFAPQAMSHGFYGEDGVSIPPTLPNMVNSMFNNSVPLSPSQALSRGYSEENGVSNPVTIPQTLPNTENSVFDNSLLLSAPPALSHEYSKENGERNRVSLLPTLPNIENSVFNNSFPLSTAQEMSHGFYEEEGVSIPPTLTNIADLIFNNTSLPASQALSSGYSEENGVSSQLTIEQTLPNTEILVYDNSFLLSATQEMPNGFYEDGVRIRTALPNIADSMFNNLFPWSASQALSGGYSGENGVDSLVTIPRTLPTTENSVLNNLFPLSAPQALSHGYSEENGVSSWVTIPPTLPNIENSMLDIGNNAGLAVSNTIGRRPGRPRGSRNKLKGENSAVMTIILNVPANVNLIDWVVQYSKLKKVHLTMLSGRGTVSEADLSHMGSHVPPKIYAEQLKLITFSGCYLFSSSADGSRSFFSVTLGRLNGDIVSGTALKMITMNNVALTVTIFHNPEMLAIKPSELMTVESNYNMLSGRSLKWSVILSFEPGTDIIQGVVQFAWYYSLKVSVLCCAGLVSEVDIAYSDSHPPFVKVTGNFQIISFSGTCDGRGATSFDNVYRSFILSIVCHNNELMSGVVVNNMKAASHITVVTLANDAP